MIYVRIHPDIKSLQWNAQRAKERIIIANKIFNRYEIVTLIVADDEGKLLGLLQLYDIEKRREERRYAKA